MSAVFRMFRGIFWKIRDTAFRPIKSRPLFPGGQQGEGCFQCCRQTGKEDVSHVIRRVFDQAPFPGLASLPPTVIWALIAHGGHPGFGFAQHDPGCPFDKTSPPSLALTRTTNVVSDRRLQDPHPSRHCRRKIASFRACHTWLGVAGTWNTPDRSMVPVVPFSYSFRQENNPPETKGESPSASAGWFTFAASHRLPAPRHR
ncbi:MAG: hypothetical protein FD153_327 [Rhodospirillaceae bacterium]|nr:MAG: hypothetical protein FD153_327 [Rhodospirillaceae bacterium]